MDNFKVPEDLTTVRNGRIMDTVIDEASIGMPDQQFNPWEPFSMGEAQRTGPSSGRIFKDGSDKSDGAGTINKNGEYGPVTYGF